MEHWIEKCTFERADFTGRTTIEGGYDEFERIDVREKEGSVAHIFKAVKRTDLFNITIHWAVEPDDDIDDDELKSLAERQLRTESGYFTSTYLRSMDYPPLQGLFSEGMVVELVPDSEDEQE